MSLRRAPIGLNPPPAAQIPDAWAKMSERNAVETDGQLVGVVLVGLDLRLARVDPVPEDGVPGERAHIG